MGGARTVLDVGAAHALAGCISNWSFSNIPCTGTSLAPRPSGIGCRRCGWTHCSISSISERYSAEHRIRRNAPSGVGHWAWPKGRAWQGWAEPSDLPACSATPQVQCLQQRGRHSQCGFFWKKKYFAEIYFCFAWKKYFFSVDKSLSQGNVKNEIASIWQITVDQNMLGRVGSRGGVNRGLYGGTFDVLWLPCCC